MKLIPQKVFSSADLVFEKHIFSSDLAVKHLESVVPVNDL